MHPRRFVSMQLAATLAIVALFELTMIVQRDGFVLAVAFGAAIAVGLIWRSCLVVLFAPVMTIMMFIIHVSIFGHVVILTHETYLEGLANYVFGITLLIATLIGATVGAAVIGATGFIQRHWDYPMRWVGDAIEQRRLRNHLLKQVWSIGQAELEDLVWTVLTGIGFTHIEPPTSSGDGGIILRGSLMGVRGWPTHMAVRVHWAESSVQPSSVQQMRADLGPREHGLLITNRDFSREARIEAKRSPAAPVEFMTGERLVDLMIEHGIGIPDASQIMLVEPV